MKRFFTYTFVCLLVLSAPAKLFAQQQQVEDSVVQLYGVVMTADSLRGLDGVSVSVKGKGRGTITNFQGVFSIAVLKGDVIEFSFIGFKSKQVNIPKNLQGSEYSIIQLLTSDPARSFGQGLPAPSLNVILSIQTYRLMNTK
jgi:hypothetical protein